MPAILIILLVDENKGVDRYPIIRDATDLLK